MRFFFSSDNNKYNRNIYTFQQLLKVVLRQNYLSFNNRFSRGSEEHTSQEICFARMRGEFFFRCQAWPIPSQIDVISPSVCDVLWCPLQFTSLMIVSEHLGTKNYLCNLVYVFTFT